MRHALLTGVALGALLAVAATTAFAYEDDTSRAAR